MSDAWRYDDRRVLVTGCSSGMGEATARELSELGAYVVGLDRKEASVTLNEFVAVDMAEATSIDLAVQRVGRVDALFNCAGISNGGGDAIQIMRVNIIGLRHLTEAIVLSMTPGSAIASISSLGGQGWERNLTTVMEFLDTPTFADAVEWCARHPEQFEGGAYGFSKQSVIVYTKRRCVEFAGRGIRINSIAPGVTQTPMLVDSAKALGGDEALNRVPAPLGRRSTPEEQARSLIFLNSNAASYITGQNLWTDAGFMGGLQTGMLNPLDLRG